MSLAGRPPHVLAEGPGLGRGGVEGQQNNSQPQARGYGDGGAIREAVGLWPHRNFLLRVCQTEHLGVTSDRRAAADQPRAGSPPPTRVRCGHAACSQSPERVRRPHFAPHLRCFALAALWKLACTLPRRPMRRLAEATGLRSWLRAGRL